MRLSLTLGRILGIRASVDWSWLVVGLPRLASVADVPRVDWARTPVGECMLPRVEVPTVSWEDSLADAAVEIGSGSPGRALVLRDGAVVGLLSVTDVGRLVADAGTSRGPSRW